DSRRRHGGRRRPGGGAGRHLELPARRHSRRNELRAMAQTLVPAASRLFGTCFRAHPAGVPMSRDAAGKSAGATWRMRSQNVKLFLRGPLARAEWLLAGGRRGGRRLALGLGFGLALRLALRLG